MPEPFGAARACAAPAHRIAQFAAPPQLSPRRPRGTIYVSPEYALTTDDGYINYFHVLQLDEDCKSGDVRNSYKRLTKSLLMEISRTQITDRRDAFLLEIAMLNAAFYILRDNDLREKYQADRANVIALEEAWQNAACNTPESVDGHRRRFDAALRHYSPLHGGTRPGGRARQGMRRGQPLEPRPRAPRQPRASPLRQRRYHEIHERLPYYEITEPQVDWEERRALVQSSLTHESTA